MYQTLYIYLSLHIISPATVWNIIIPTTTTRKLIQDPQQNGILLGLLSVSQLKGLLWEGGQRALLPTLKSSHLRSSAPPRHLCPCRPVPPGKWRVDLTLCSSKWLPFTCPVGPCLWGARLTALGFMGMAVSPAPTVVTFLPLHTWESHVQRRWVYFLAGCSHDSLSSFSSPSFSIAAT